MKEIVCNNTVDRGHGGYSKVSGVSVQAERLAVTPHLVWTTCLGARHAVGIQPTNLA